MAFVKNLSFKPQSSTASLLPEDFDSAFVHDEIERFPVVLFVSDDAHGNSQRAVDLIFGAFPNPKSVKIVDLDVEERGHRYAAVLRMETNCPHVPYVFINGEYVGDYEVIHELNIKCQLVPRLNKYHALDIDVDVAEHAAHRITSPRMIASISRKNFAKAASFRAAPAFASPGAHHHSSHHLAIHDPKIEAHLRAAGVVVFAARGEASSERAVGILECVWGSKHFANACRLKGVREGFEVVDLKGDELREALRKRTGGAEAPYIFVAGEFVGGTENLLRAAPKWNLDVPMEHL